jgi:hypothetical protein
MSTAVATIELINLDDPSGAGDFSFRRFPRSVDTTDKTNYEAADVAGFVKPVIHANAEPQIIVLQEVWLDNSDSLQSVLPDVERLRGLMRRGGDADAPPTLQLIIGDWSVEVVLVEMKAERVRFTGENVQTRARLSLTFWETDGGNLSGRAPGNRPEDAKFSF